MASVGNGGCSALCALGKTLVSLDLSFNPSVKTHAFLGALTLLEELDLSLNVWVDDEVAALCATSMPRLRRLVLEKTEVTDAAIVHLGSARTPLAHLDLSRTSVRGNAESYAALRGMGSLEILLMPYTLVDLQLAFHLPPSLRRLKLSRAVHFDDDALACLAHAVESADSPSLCSLDVGSPAITDASLPSLLALAQGGLVSLSLWHCKVSRTAIEQLMADTGMRLDDAMASSDGTYLLQRAQLLAAPRPMSP
jgi:hypothetical protein